MTQKILPLSQRHDSMRGWFAYELYNHMVSDPLIWVITGDLGYKVFDHIRRDFPERFLNTGSAEQTMIGTAVGLALQGKKPFVYSITPFLLYRPFETIRNYIHHEKIPVRLIGSGRDQNYSHDGFSHWSSEDREVLKIFHEITPYWPEQNSDLPAILKRMVKENVPAYLNLTRT